MSELLTVMLAEFLISALPLCCSSRMKLASNCGANRKPPSGPDIACIAAVPPEVRPNASQPTEKMFNPGPFFQARYSMPMSRSVLSRTSYSVKLKVICGAGRSIQLRN